MQCSSQVAQAVPSSRGKDGQRLICGATSAKKNDAACNDSRESVFLSYVVYVIAGVQPAGAPLIYDAAHFSMRCLHRSGILARISESGTTHS